MAKIKQDILVKKHRGEGKFRICFAHTPDKWFVISAQSPVQARAVAKAQEVYLVGAKTPGSLFGQFAADFYNPTGEWAQYIQRKGRQPYGGYYARLANFLDNYIMGVWASMPMASMEPMAIDEWVNGLQSRTKGTPLSADSKNQILTTFRHIFDYAKYKGVVENNPIEHIKQYHGGRKREAFALHEIQALFPDDEQELRRIWPSLRWLVFFMILRDTGLRTGEALALAWENYSEQLGCFAIVQKFEQSTNRILPGTKTGVTRAVAISRRCAAYLSELKKGQARESGLIFSVNGEVPYSENNVNDRLRDALDRAQIPRFANGQGRTAYSFRHAFVTNALSASLHPDEVALLAGHSRQVQKGYNHPSNDHLFKRIQHLREQVETLYCDASNT